MNEGYSNRRYVPLHSNFTPPYNLFQFPVNVPYILFLSKYHMHTLNYPYSNLVDIPHPHHTLILLLLSVLHGTFMIMD